MQRWGWDAEAAFSCSCDDRSGLWEGNDRDVQQGGSASMSCCFLSSLTPLVVHRVSPLLFLFHSTARVPHSSLAPLRLTPLRSRLPTPTRSPFIPTSARPPSAPLPPLSSGLVPVSLYPRLCFRVVSGRGPTGLNSGADGEQQTKRYDCSH